MGYGELRVGLIMIAVCRGNFCTTDIGGGSSITLE